MKLKPLGNRVVVRRNELKKSRGGILLPESTQEKPRQGQVVAVGSEKIDVKEGDEVLFSPYAGTEYQDQYLILSEDDLLGVYHG